MNLHLFNGNAKIAHLIFRLNRVKSRKASHFHILFDLLLSFLKHTQNKKENKMSNIKLTDSSQQPDQI